MSGQLQSSQAQSASAAPAEGGSDARASRPAEGMSPWSGMQKLNLTTRETTWIIGSSRVFQRLRYHGWLKPLCASRDVLYPRSRILAAQEKMEKGEMPPLLPSEKRERAKRQGECASLL